MLSLTGPLDEQQQKAFKMLQQNSRVECKLKHTKNSAIIKPDNGISVLKPNLKKWKLCLKIKTVF